MYNWVVFLKCHFYVFKADVCNLFGVKIIPQNKNICEIINN